MPNFSGPACDFEMGFYEEIQSQKQWKSKKKKKKKKQKEKRLSSVRETITVHDKGKGEITFL